MLSTKSLSSSPPPVLPARKRIRVDLIANNWYKMGFTSLVLDK